MEYLFLTIIGGAILFLAFLFLPLKISTKQKAIFVVLAIIFSQLFFILYAFLPDWQAAAILIFTIMIVTYILVKHPLANKAEEITEVAASNEKVEKEVDEKVQAEESIHVSEGEETVEVVAEDMDQTTIEQAVVAEPELDIPVTTTEEATSQITVEEVKSEPEEIIIEEEIEEEEAEFEPIEVGFESAVEQFTVPKRLNRDLMDTLVQQLLWYKHQLSDDQYEQLIIDHVKEQLHDNDYYLFASMLRDHYIKTEQLDKLKSLLNRLKQRYHNKIIILKEITFFEEKFFQS